MRQRVGIARAYANDPKVMLMDEPFGHLDAQTRYMMEAELEKIWQKEKRTVVFVTNNSEEAVYLADRIAFSDITQGFHCDTCFLSKFLEKHSFIGKSNHKFVVADSHFQNPF